MKLLIKKNIVYSIVPPIVLAIPAFQGMAHRLITMIIKGSRCLRFFIPRKRKFYYPKEQAAYRAAMERKKNNFPGQGPPL